ncbi:transposase, partial [Streptomyces sp. NPDC056367]|uniref:transposase n=1 Tax=Streptomyces sp. NPDC056367 TaxID=3345797 RepID=UPI0035E3295B
RKGAGTGVVGITGSRIRAPRPSRLTALAVAPRSWRSPQCRRERPAGAVGRTGRSGRKALRTPFLDLELLAFYDFPAEHWIHLRTTNPIESTFSTVKLRTRVTRGAGSPAAALAMVFKLVESDRTRWRAITGAHLVPPVRAGARFKNGILVERPGATAA